jgi:hypothetical protein
VGSCQPIKRLKDKKKKKEVHSRIGDESPEGEYRHISTLSLT